MSGFSAGIVGNGWDALDGMTPTPLPRVTVVLAYFEQPDDLRRTLRALARQTHPAELLEIIVVDDGSAVPPVVPDGIRVLRQENSGFRAAAARNLGAAAATGDVLCFLDADCAPEDDYVERMIRLPALNADVVAVGRRRHADLSRLPDDAVLGEVMLGDLPTDALLSDPSWLRDGYLRSGNLLHADARSYRYLISAVLACSRSFFVETGGFDETFTRYGGEDWEWAWRCWEQGAVFAHVPDAVAWHNGPDAAERGRDVAAGNAETLLLQGLVPVGGSRPHALMGGMSDVTVRVAGVSGSAVAQTIITVDSLLRQLPTAHLYLESSARDALGAVGIDDQRLHAGPPPSLSHYRVDVLAPVRVEGTASLRQLLESVGVGSRGAVHIADDDGVLLTLTSSRVAARRRRSGDSAFRNEVVSATGIVRRLGPDEPSLAAYYGDWD